MTTPVSKTWFITGASSGFGKALAEAALERGDKVVATARNMESLRDLAARWPATSHLVTLDVTNPEQIRAAFEEATRVFPNIDILVNNAGYGLLASLEESTNEQIERNFAVNFFGALEVIRAALPVFRRQKSGHVINISAAAAISNYAGFGIYGASKAALEGVSESLALEGRAFGLKVTIVQPGPFRTDFISRSLDTTAVGIPEYAASVGKFGKFLESINGKQPGDPALAAQAILGVVDSEKPPLRLVLGKYAVEKARRTLVQREAEQKVWETVGLSTDRAPSLE